MASTYTPLGIEKMATGENAGTWGTKTNTNLDIIEQISGGFKVQTLNTAGAGANTTAVTQTNGGTGSTVATRIIILGAVSPETISGNKIVTFPVLTENFYFIENSTSGAYTVQLKAASGSGATVTWATGDKGWKLIYFDGVATNTGVDTSGNELFKLTATGSAVNELTYNNASTGNKPTFTASGGDTNIGVSIQPKGSGTITLDNLTFPAADGSANQILTTNGSGVLSFVDNSGGTSWQAIKTGNYTASAGEGVFANTTAGAFTVTLPASPSLGDEVSIVDYAGTFDTNNLTVGRNSQPIMGTAADLTVSIERAGLTLAYVDSTQGWLLKDK